MPYPILRDSLLVLVATTALLAGCSTPQATVLARDTGIEVKQNSILKRDAAPTHDGYVVVVTLSGDREAVLKSLYTSSQGECAKMIPVEGRCFYVYRSGRPVVASVEANKLVVQVQ